MVPGGLTGGSEVEREIAVILSKGDAGLALERTIYIELHEIRAAQPRDVIPRAGADNGRGKELRVLTGGGGDKEPENVRAADARLAQIKSFEVTAARVLPEHNVLITRRRTARPRRIQGSELYPCFDGEVGWAEERRIRNLYRAV